MAQVVSLHRWGGPLTNTCAAALDDSVVVMQMSKTLGRPIAPKAHWKAHGGGVSALHRSPFAIQLFTGGGDGQVHTCVAPHPSLFPAQLCFLLFPAPHLSLLLPFHHYHPLHSGFEGEARW